MWGRIVSSVSNALDFNQATLSGCIDIICVRNPHTGELHSTPFHVRFGKAKLLRSREKIVTVTVNSRPTSLVMKLGAAGEAYFMQEVEDNVGVAEEELASPLCSPVQSPRRICAQPTDASLPTVTEDPQPLPPSHPGQVASLSTATSGVAADGRRTADSPQEPPREGASASPSSPAEGLVPKEGRPPSLSADSTWRSAWGTAARYEGTTAGMSDGSPVGGFGEAEASAAEREEDGRAAVQFSLCGHVLFGTADEAQHDADVFKANIVTWEALEENPALWYHPSLVACFERTPPYYPAKVALPLLASWLLFNRPLSLNSVKRLMTAEIIYTDKEGSGWAPWQTDGVGSASGVLRPRPEPLSSLDSSRGSPRRDQLQGATCSSGVNSDSECPAFAASTQPANGKRLRRSLRPTPQQLEVVRCTDGKFYLTEAHPAIESLDLKPGANSVTFTVSSSLQGEKSVCGTIYLWPTDIKIVVSDVDGTITRSDVLGQLMPIVGRDWSHTGVAELFTKIKKSGYLILYLTARAIGQADATRDYLFGLTQKERDKLPDGPLILSPDRLFPSFRREVIDRKPYIFKIAALRDIRSLFPSNRNPFYAGFGNRESDHRAYIHVGIPEAKIFIIDTAGVIHHISNSTYARTYETMSEIAEHMFPPLKDSPIARGQSGQDMEEREEEEFNAFNYWSVAFEPRSEYGDSDGGSGDEADESSAVVTATANLSISVKGSSPRTAGSSQEQCLRGSSAGGRLALNYYFGLEQTDNIPHQFGRAAGAVACRSNSAVSRGSGDSSSVYGKSLSAQSSSSSFTSSSPSLPIDTSLLLANARSLPQQLLFPPQEQQSPASSHPQHSDGLRRSASEGNELAALDVDKRETRCVQKQQPQQQHGSTSRASGMLLLPTVTTISSFGLGSLAFRTGAGSANSGSHPNPGVAAAPTATTDESPQVLASVAAAVSSSRADSFEVGLHPIEGRVEALKPESSGTSESCERSRYAPSASPVSRDTSVGLMLPVRSSAAVSADSVTRSNAHSKAQRTASTTDLAISVRAATNQPTGQVVRSMAVCRGGNTSLYTAFASLPSHCEARLPYRGCDYIMGGETRAGGSLHSEGLVVDGAAPVSAQLNTVAKREINNTAEPPALYSGHSLTARAPTDVKDPTGISAEGDPDYGETRAWLLRNAREMHACSSTSAMLMALAQDTPRRLRQPEPPTTRPANASLNLSMEATCAVKAGAMAARTAPGKPSLSRGRSIEGLGSYASFESADATTSRCDSFASVASRPRTDDEAQAHHSQELQEEQQVNQQQKHQRQQVGELSDADNSVPRDAETELQGTTEAAFTAAGQGIS